MTNCKFLISNKTSNIKLQKKIDPPRIRYEDTGEGIIGH